VFVSFFFFFFFFFFSIWLPCSYHTDMTMRIYKCVSNRRVFVINNS
jgi:hypothetical protein